MGKSESVTVPIPEPTEKALDEFLLAQSSNLVEGIDWDVFSEFVTLLLSKKLGVGKLEE